MTAVDARVVRVLSRTAMIGEDSVARGASLASLDIGSLEQIECVLALEEEFRLELVQSDLRKLRTVQDVIDLVEQALARQT